MLFQSPEGVVLTVQQSAEMFGVMNFSLVSVPRRGSADGATLHRQITVAAGSAFQSPEGVVLTVQRERFNKENVGEYVSVPRRGSADGATRRAELPSSGDGYVSVPRRGSADGAT